MSRAHPETTSISSQHRDEETSSLIFPALDVFEVEPLAGSDLLRHDSFHGSPHIAASTLEAQARIGTEMAGSLIQYFETGGCNNSLN